VRLFCFPFAGGGASVYRTWARELPGIDVIAVQPPGREDRYSEPAYTNLRRLTADLASEIAPLLDRPAVFFGHSMGGAIAYQLAVDLKPRGLGPRLLILSARHAPHVPLTRPPIHTLSDQAFIAELRKLSGTPSAVLENQELMDFLLPILRADFELCDTHTCPREASVDVPLLVFGGEDDATARPPALEAWRDYSTGAMELRLFPGGHFFLQTHQPAVLQAIRAAVTALV
jgi:medium-chain acyl-[acyl-carrier-protein] hydrolase